MAAVVPPVAALSSLRYADFWALSATGCVPLSALVKYVAVCVRVCWYCHQTGGTDVVDLPDILLPAGQYLDLFDSESETDVPSDSSDEEQTNKQKFKVRQPQRAARSKRPNTPSDGSKNNGIHTTKQEEYPSRHPTTDTANKSPAGD